MQLVNFMSPNDGRSGNDPEMSCITPEISVAMYVFYFIFLYLGERDEQMMYLVVSGKWSMMKLHEIWTSKSCLKFNKKGSYYYS